MALGKDVFVALAAVVWADGRVTPEEAAALVRAAQASGLAGADLLAVEHATRTRTSLDALDVAALDPDVREYVYALATMLARADGQVVEEERVVLQALGDRLGLDGEARERAAVAARALAGPSDLQALANALADA